VREVLSAPKAVADKTRDVLESMKTQR